MKKALAFILLLFVLQVGAQTFRATVNTTRVSTEEYVIIQFSFSGSDVNGLTDLKLPNFEGFQVLSGPNTSTSMSYVNGQTTASRAYSYYIQASQPGKFTIGSASINYKGKTLRTDPVTITVEAGTRKSAEPSAEGDLNAQIKENLFINANANKTSVYVGEQVNVDYKLYTRLNFSYPSNIKLPSYQGFWAEEIEDGGNVTLQDGVYQGKMFKIGTLKRAALFPTETGKLKVTPFALTLPVIIEKQQKGGFFSNPFFRQTETVNYDAVSNTLVIDVKPLPEGAGAYFTGAVGNFTMTASFDKQKVKRNESVTLTVTLRGEGNIKLLTLPELELPQSFERYEPQVEETISSYSPVAGTKVFKFLFVPRQSGSFEVEPIRFTFFNLAAKKYETLTGSSFTLNVENASAIVNDDAVNQGLGNDIRPIAKTSSSFTHRGDTVLASPLLYASFIIPLLAFIGLVGYVKRNNQLNADPIAAKMRKARKLAEGKLKLVKPLINGADKEKFYTGLSEAVSGYISDRFNVARAEFSVERTIQILTDKEVSEESLVSFKQLLSDCDMLRFAPVDLNNYQPIALYERAVSSIMGLEEELSTKAGESK